MIGLKSLVLKLTLLFGNVSAELIGTTLLDGTGAAEMYACFEATNSLTFDFKRPVSSKYYGTVCAYPPALGTMFLCFDDLTDSDTKIHEKIFDRIVNVCHEYGTYNYTAEFYKEQYTNATTNYIIPFSEVNISLPIYYPTLINLTATQLQGYREYSQTYYNDDTGTWFAVSFCGYFLLLILISAIYNGFRMIGLSKKINQTQFAKLFQKFVIFPAILPKGQYSQYYGYKYLTILFPNRIQALVDLFFCALEIAFYSASYKTTPDTEYALSAWIGRRSAVMACGKLPLLILFAGRNNFLLWITGWSYATCLHFHKTTAIWMFIDATIHSVGFTHAWFDYYDYYIHVTYFASGVAATTFAGVMILQSLHCFRNFYYEYFLTIHVVFAICFIITCWYHCNVLGWMEWMVSACCIWFFDRLLRFIRMCGFGYRTATITVIGDQLFKIEVPKPKWWIHTPGSYGYIYFAGIIFWENHPFTIVCEDDKVCAFIRVKKGVTARVWKKLVANNNSMTWRICIEGPYGGRLSEIAKKYDDSIFIAGGSGAPSILESAAQCSNGKLIWVTQTLEFVIAYQKLVEKINIPMDIYVTRESAENRQCTKKALLSESESDTQSTDISEKNDKEAELGFSKQISIIYGRPNVKEIINHEVNGSHSSNVAIVACGPPALMDNLRSVISENITSWEKSVDFFDEFQIW